MEVPTQSADLQAQFLTWKGEVDTVRNHLRSMRARLEEMAPRRTNPDGMAQIEHFQNRFIRHQEVADEMYHDLKQSAKSISNAQPAILHDDRPIDDFDTLQDRMQMFHKLYEELKNEFYRFESFS